MSNELARRLYLFRVQAAEALRDSPVVLSHMLREEYHLNAAAAASLSRYITRQETLSEVPDLGTLLIERLSTQACAEYYFHTPLPCPANEALLRVVSRRLQQTGPPPVVAMAANLGFMLVMDAAAEMTPDSWRAILATHGFAADLAANLRDSSLLRERFAQIAQTGLMVLRHGSFRSADIESAEPLFDRVQRLAPDFLLMQQAEREVADGPCDLKTALAFVQRLNRMQLRQRWLAEPSPFADSLLASHSGALELT
jgi:Lhr-like helicase